MAEAQQEREGYRRGTRERIYEGKRGNHLRWHVQQGIVVAGCEWCESCDSKPKDDRVPDESVSGDPIGPDSIETETTSASASETTSASSSPTAAGPISTDHSQVDDPRFDVVVELLAERATNKAGKIGTTRERYKKGVVTNTIAERSDTIRHLLAVRPSATAETIVDLVEHEAAAVRPARRDPNANHRNIDRVVDELVAEELIGGSPFVPPELAAPLPPDLAARARHQEDELEAVAS